MSKAIKGALFSALVFPGVGELVLKSYARGAALVAISLACLTTLVLIAVQQAQTILDAMMSSGEVVDLEAITRSAHEAATGAASWVANAALLVLVFCWVTSIVDAYRIGKRADAQEATHG